MVGWLEFNVPFQHKYGYIRDEMVAHGVGISSAADTLFFSSLAEAALLWPPCVADADIIFGPSSSFPRLISAVTDCMSTILPHMVLP